MSNKVYIDKKTFEIYGSLEDERISGPLFECDELMAPTIQILNKLGFKTQDCCSGHVYDFKHPKNLIPTWVDNTCCIVFTDTLDTLKEKGFTVPEGFEVRDPSDYLEPWEYDWGFILEKEFDERENKFFQVIDAAKALYGWACAMAYAKQKEWEAAKKKMEEVVIQLDIPKPSERIVFAKDDPIFTKITFYDDVLNKEVTVTVKDYLDFVIAVRISFQEAIGEDLSKVYPDLKRAYEHTRQRYLIPLLKPTQYCELAEIIYTSLEELYGDLYDQYNDPTGLPVVSDKYYIYLNELVDTVDKYIVENYKVK